MPIIRANDPHANDTAYQIKTVLGKMCDAELSAETRKDCVEKLTSIMKGLPFTEDTFRRIGLEARFVTVDNEASLHIRVPKEFVSSGIEENRDNQWVVFGINRAINTENLGHSDTAVITDLKGNLIEFEENKEEK